MGTAKILSIATAVPSFKLRQDDISLLAEKIFGDTMGDFSRFLPVYRNAAIDTRYSCMPLEWYGRASSLAERNALYLENAVKLLEEAAVKALEKAGLGFSDIDGLVVVSSSGIATPSLDALLMEKLHLKRNMERLPIFGFGCAGGVIGLSRAAQLAQGAPEKRYLYMVVELCGLNFLYRDRSKSNVIATAIFSDGASAAVISCTGAGPEIKAWSEHTWPDSLGVMGWDVTDDGLKAVFSQDIPSIVRHKMRPIVDDFLQQNDLNIESIRNFLCHPGGAKVLDALEAALTIPMGSLNHSRDVLRNYGNMSAATAMFVLEAALQNPQAGDYILSSLGPGFTAALLWMKIL